MAWLQLETDLGNRDPASLEVLIEELGAVAISLQDAGDHPLLEPAPGETPIWPTVMLTALFPAQTRESTIVAALKGQFSPEMLRFARIEDQDWQANFKHELKPRRFGQRLWITPDNAQTLPAGSRALMADPRTCLWEWPAPNHRPMPDLAGFLKPDWRSGTGLWLRFRSPGARRGGTGR